MTTPAGSWPSAGIWVWILLEPANLVSDKGCTFQERSLLCGMGELFSFNIRPYSLYFWQNKSRLVLKLQRLGHFICSLFIIFENICVSGEFQRY